MTRIVAFVGPMLGRHSGLVPNPAEELADRFPSVGVECRLVSQHPQPLVRAADTVQCLARWTRELDFAVIVTYSGRAFHQADLASRVLTLSGVPHAFYLKGGSLPTFAVSRQQRVTRVLRRGCSVIAPSSYLERFARELELNTHIIPNVFPIEDYEFSVRRDLDRRILWLRAFHDMYDPQTAVRTLRMLRDRGHDMSLTMAGSDKGCLAATCRLVSDLGLTNHVDFVGFVSAQEKHRLFRSHHLFLHTSLTDNTPVSVYEAMASGLPVVGTRVGGMPDFVESCATLVPPRRPDELARGVEELLNDAELSELRSAGGRSLVERYSWTSVAPLWLAEFGRHGRVVNG